MSPKPKNSQAEGWIVVATANCSVSMGVWRQGKKNSCRARTIQSCRTKVRFLLPQLQHRLSTDRALRLDKTLERFDQHAGVEGGSNGRQVCLLGISHTMNQVKVLPTEIYTQVAIYKKTRGIARREKFFTFGGNTRAGQGTRGLIYKGFHRVPPRFLCLPSIRSGVRPSSPAPSLSPWISEGFFLSGHLQKALLISPKRDSAPVPHFP